MATITTVTVQVTSEYKLIGWADVQQGDTLINLETGTTHHIDDVDTRQRARIATGGDYGSWKAPEVWEALGFKPFRNN